MWAFILPSMSQQNSGSIIVRETLTLSAGPLRTWSKSPMARRGRTTRSNRQAVVVTLVFFFISALAGTWLLSDGLRDAQDLTWVRCEVVNAESQRGGRFASVPWFVVVHTAYCGPIIYQLGTNEENVDSLADNLVAGYYEYKHDRAHSRRCK